MRKFIFNFVISMSLIVGFINLSFAQSGNITIHAIAAFDVDDQKIKDPESLKGKFRDMLSASKTKNVTISASSDERPTSKWESNTILTKSRVESVLQLLREVDGSLNFVVVLPENGITKLVDLLNPSTGRNFTEEEVKDLSIDEKNHFYDECRYLDISLQATPLIDTVVAIIANEKNFEIDTPTIKKGAVRENFEIDTLSSFFEENVVSKWRLRLPVQLEKNLEFSFPLKKMNYEFDLAIADQMTTPFKNDPEFRKKFAFGGPAFGLGLQATAKAFKGKFGCGLNFWKPVIVYKGRDTMGQKGLCITPSVIFKIMENENFVLTTNAETRFSVSNAKLTILPLLGLKISGRQPFIDGARTWVGMSAAIYMAVPITQYGVEVWRYKAPISAAINLEIGRR